MMEGFPAPHAVPLTWSAEKMYAGQTLSPVQRLKGISQVQKIHCVIRV